MIADPDTLSPSETTPVAEYTVSIKSIRHITHDVSQIITEKPAGLSFTPGQATEIAIDKKGWEYEKRPFTFTCLPTDSYLEFTIKSYPAHLGVTKEIQNLKVNDKLILHEVFGAIAYKGEGVFIAGGAGITPFISILRDLNSRNEIGNNKLIFANKTKGDIILEEELKTMLGANFINILSQEKLDGYEYGKITETFLETKITANKIIYLCGPPPMIKEMEQQLSNLKFNKNNIVKESL